MIKLNSWFIRNPPNGITVIVAPLQSLSYETYANLLIIEKKIIGAYNINYNRIILMFVDVLSIICILYPKKKYL